MEIKQPRRILFLTLGNSTSSDHRSATLALVRSLTGSKPDIGAASGDSISGISHIWDLKTPYYSASIPIWIDEIAENDLQSPTDSMSADTLKSETLDASDVHNKMHTGIRAWKSEFMSSDASEVIRAVGAWVLCFPHPASMQEFAHIEQAINAVYAVIQEAHADSYGPSWDGTCLAVALMTIVAPRLNKTSDEWEQVGLEQGFEFIDMEATGKNDFGEVQGLDRLLEALEATEWRDENADDFADFADFEGEGELEHESDFTQDQEQAEFNGELWGLKAALLQRGGGEGEGEDEEDKEETEEESERQVEELGRMMSRLRAVKELSASMPEAERKKFAARAVRDIMNDIG